MSDTLVFSEERMLEHRTGSFHAESPERLEAVLAALEGLAVERRPVGLAPFEALARVHAPEYVRAIDSLRHASTHLDPDTPLNPGSVLAAELAAGGAIAAVDAVLRREARNAFGALRPPGHHAERARAMGFCVFNNIAIAVEHARANMGVERVLVIDWDVHHGNGTQNRFYDRRDVLFFDMHQAPFYPGTGHIHEVGRGAGEGYTINVPFPAGLGDGDYRLAMEELLVPIAASFDPDLVMVSSGFDAHRDDPLGEERVTEDGFAAMCGVARRIADASCDGRLVLLLEGGYDLKALGRSARATVQVLCGDTPPAPRGTTLAGERVVREVLASARRYWNGLG